VRRFGRTDEQVLGDKSPITQPSATTPSAALAQNRR